MNHTPLKVCRKCGVEKPNTAEFYAKSNKGKSLTSDCKVCRHKEARARLALKPKKKYSRGVAPTKCCRVCRKQVPKKLFPLSSSKTKDGTGGTCIPCIKAGEAARAARKAIKRERVATLSQKTCAKCHQLLPMTEEFFARNSKEYSGFKSRCKACISEAHKVAYAANPEEFRLYGRKVAKARQQRDPVGFSLQARAKKHRRRLAELQADTESKLTKELLEVIAHEQQWLCWYCNVPMNAAQADGYSTQITFDHLTAVTRGGTNARENLVCACRSCNSSKAYRLGWNWLGISREEWDATKGKGLRKMLCQPAKTQERFASERTD